jgi:hypothetical protein
MAEARDGRVQKAVRIGCFGDNPQSADYLCVRKGGVNASPFDPGALVPPVVTYADVKATVAHCVVKESA